MEEQKLEVYQDIIDKLLHNHTLSDTEKSIVKNDSEFLSYQKEFSILSKGIRKSAMHKKLNEIKELENDLSSASANVDKPSNKRKWLLAASLLFILGAAYLVLQLNKGGSYDKDFLIADNILNFPLPNGTRSVDVKEINIAYVHYQKGDHDTAIKEFEKLILKDNDPKLKFYLAISLLQKQKYKAAQNLLLDKSLKDNRELPINYYLALTKIGTDEPKEAIELLSNPTLSSPIFDKYRKKMIHMLSR